MEAKIMKRILSAVVAVVMALTLCVSAFAAYEEPVVVGLFFGDPDNGGWGAAATVEVTGPGEYTLSYEGEARNLNWIIIKNNAGETEPTSIPAGTTIRTTSIVMDGVEATFDTGEYYDATTGFDGTLEIQYTNTFTGYAHITNFPASVSSIEVTFVVDPDNAPAESETPAEETPAEETPADTTTDTTDTTTDTTTETPAETGIVLAVLPVAVAAAAAVVVSKKRK
mgnify:CR=1 FL=1